MILEVQKKLRSLANPAQAKQLQRFFKTAPGEYGAGDLFLGLKVPQVRAVAKEFANLAEKELKTLTTSKYHEERLLGFIIISNKYQKAKAVVEKNQLFRLYIAQKKGLNNWDLIDVSIINIVGAHLYQKDCALLYKWARSNNLWERRMSVLSTFYFLKNGEFAHSLKIADILLQDEEDLIHKAVGWMLREIWKRDKKLIEKFVIDRAHVMPRTMLRYAIEKIAEPKRKKILAL